MQSKPHQLPSDEANDSGLWRPQPGRFTSDELMEAMVEAACAGPACSHDRPNVLWKIDRLVSGEPDSQFGLTGLNSFTPTDVLGMVAIEAGFDPDPRRRDGDVPIDPWRVLAACNQAGKRLADASARRERSLDIVVSISRQRKACATGALRCLATTSLSSSWWPATSSTSWDTKGKEVGPPSGSELLRHFKWRGEPAISLPNACSVEPV